MLLIMYLIPLVAWAVFVYHMHHTGERPTTYWWWAIMVGLGTFELSKGIATTIGGIPAVPSAFCAGVLSAGAVLVLHTRRSLSGAGPIPAGGR
jgi:hypothetical protein